MSRKRKYSDELRQEVVMEVLSGRCGGCKSVADRYGIHHENVERWVRLYEEHGEKGLSYQRGKYDGTFKIHVVEYMHEKNLSLREAAIQFCIPAVATVMSWERIYYEEGPEGLLNERRGGCRMKKPSQPKNNTNENEDLLAEVQRLRMENEYLKKLNALVLEREKSEQKKK